MKEREGVLQIRHSYFEIKYPNRLDKNEALKSSVETRVIHAEKVNSQKAQSRQNGF
ncbi:MAG: hypothetical protein LBH43_00940 [Treponema sp.]|nr:hypothetical protein [Treponema sp.]